MQYNAKPFNLTKSDIDWVESTFSSMTFEEKIGQLFCPIGYSTDPDYLDNQLLAKNIGGLFFRDGIGTEMQSTFAYAQNNSKIPLLVASNLEAGGDGAAIDGTPYGKQMEVAATNEYKYAYRLGKISCSEAAALGINWAFAPVVDIDNNFRNPITNVRTYGNDPEKIIGFAKEYMRGANEEHVAVAIKHFPGDGVDERDQHILTSVNSLSMEEWDRSYGHIYKTLIAEGALSVMVGHIAMPAYQTHFNPSMTDKYMPASLSYELLQKLLRGKLGFNGLIVTDATPMVGYTAAMKRKMAIPFSIESGCDMILFNRDLNEDFQYMIDGYNSGILSENRLNEAVKRVLAMKAALKLHVKKQNGNLVPGKDALSILKCKKHVDWAYELADKSITLVKDTQNLLPVSPEKTKRVLLEMLGNAKSCDRVLNSVKAGLEKKGFIVTVYEKEDFSKEIDNVTMIREKYDLVIYIGNVENESNKTTNRLEWYTFFGQGNNVPWFVKEIPTMFISLANPYHLFDVPMIQTYINCYSNNDYVIETVINKICGNGRFIGLSPIDPFCGRRELRF